MDLSLKRKASLKSKKAIELLFKKGSKISDAPLKFRYIKSNEPIESEVFFKIAFTVPKRYVKKAVDRNLIKRRIKEAYRIHKNIVSKDNNQYIGMFIYNSSTLENYDVIEKKMVQLLETLNSELNKS